MTHAGTQRRITAADIAAVSSEDPGARASLIAALAARVAGGGDDGDVVETLVEVSLLEKRDDARKSWLQYISASRDVRFMAVLCAWAAEESPDLRGRVVQVAALIEDHGGNEVNEFILERICKDPSQVVRRIAVGLLVRRGSLGKWSPIDLLAIVEEGDWIPVRKKEFTRLIQTLPENHPLNRLNKDEQGE